MPSSFHLKNGRARVRVRDGNEHTGPRLTFGKLSVVSLSVFIPVISTLLLLFLAKVGLTKVGLAKVGLAKMGLAEI